MSGRGGRGGGRSRTSPAESSSSSSSSQRGGGGGGRGRGRGRTGAVTGGGYSQTPQPSVYTQPPVVSDIGSTSSSTDVSSLTRDVENRLTLSPAPIQPKNPPPPASSKSGRFPARPGPGTVGSRCVVKANHFLVEVSDKDLHHYDVSITPEVKSRGVNRAILKQLVEMYGESHLGKYKPVYDGRKSLYTAGPLPFNSKEFFIKLADKDGSSSTRNDREFKVAIKFASKADLHHLQQFLRGRQMDAPQEVIQCLDIVLRESPSTNYTIAGRSFFSTKFGEPKHINNGLECWRGYYQSLRPTQMGLSLNIDLSATSFYKPMNVVDFVMEFLNLRDKNKPLSDQDRVKVKKVLRGVRVELTHLKGTLRKRIAGITSQPTIQLTFPTDDKGTHIYVVEFFKEKYGITLQRVNWPCLQCGTDAKPVYLPMELCKIVEGQKYSKKLNEKQVTGILKAACQRPPERESNIVGLVGQNDYNGDKFVAEFGMKVENRLTLISGARVLPAPMLKYHDTGRDVKVQPRMGQWSMTNSKMVNGGRVDYWACLNFSRMNPNQAFRFFQELVAVCAHKGMAFNPNPLLPMKSARPDHIEKTLVEVHSHSVSQLAKMGATGKQLQLLIIILPDFRGGSYGKIKRICETELGIVSQCCEPKHAERPGNQYLENISLKINVKVGGRNTVLDDALLRRIPHVSDVPTIIFGADVTHPQPGEDSSPSIAAVVASMDWPEVSKYRCLVAAQPHRQEIIEDLFKVVEDPQKGKRDVGMIRELLRAFRISTGHKPHRIIFFRDGVSEGQFAQVLLHELDAIHKACAYLEEGYLPPVTFVVVQKRHHTRLFPANHNDRRMTDKSGNILAGTVVDTMICHPKEFDFYLCSHAGIQGTSRPTHYHVLYDDNKFSSDELQMLTNNLCYTYARCTRSVSIVPPAYYAHLGAFRARHYIEGDMSDSGSSTAGGAAVRNTREGSAAIRALPQVKDCVKDVMFYC